MSIIKDGFNRLLHREVTQAPVKKAKEDSPEALISTTEQVMLSGQNSPEEVSKVISQVKEELVNPLTEFVKQNPNLSGFMGSLTTGFVAGLLEKKAEERKTLEQPVKNEKHVEASAEKPLELSKELIDYLEELKEFAKDYETIRLSKNGNFLRLTKDKFITIPPSKDSLIICGFFHDNEGNKPFAEQQIDLKSLTKNTDKPSCLTYDKNDAKIFYLNYPQGDHVEKFSYNKGYGLEPDCRLDLFPSLIEKEDNKNYLAELKEYMSNTNRLSKNGNFLGVESNKFVTLHPVENTLVLCGIFCDNEGDKPFVEQQIDLKKLTKNTDKPSHLTYDSDHREFFYLNYPKGDHVEKFSYSKAYGIEYDDRIDLFGGYNLAK